MGCANEMVGWTKYLIRKARVVVETMFVEHRPLKRDRAISHGQLKGRHTFTAHVHNNGRRPKKGVHWVRPFVPARSILGRAWLRVELLVS